MVIVFRCRHQLPAQDDARADVDEGDYEQSLALDIDTDAGGVDVAHANAQVELVAIKLHDGVWAARRVPGIVLAWQAQGNALLKAASNPTCKRSVAHLVVVKRVVFGRQAGFATRRDDLGLDVSEPINTVVL